MKTKKCALCNEIKVESEFNKKSKGRLQPYCRPCNKLKSREYYKNNKKDQIEKILKSRDLRKDNRVEELINYFKLNPCVDCGEKDPLVLEFDHKDPKDKSFGISEALGKMIGWEKIKNEINKCEVRCANCHRRKTAKDFNWRMYRLLKNNIAG